MTGETAILKLPYPPSVNLVWRSLAFISKYSKKPMVRVVISKRGNQYFAEVAKVIMAARPPRFEGVKLNVYVKVVPPDRRKRDLDNLGKVLMDSLQKCGVIDDDANIDVLTFCRAPVEKPGYVIIEVKEQVALLFKEIDR